MKAFIQAVPGRVRERRLYLLAFILVMALLMAATRAPRSRSTEVLETPCETTPILIGGGMAVQRFPSPFSHISSLRLRLGCEADGGGVLYRVRVFSDGQILYEADLRGPFPMDGWVDIPLDIDAALDQAVLRVEIEGVRVPGGQGIYLYYSPYPNDAEPFAVDGDPVEGRLMLTAAGTVISREKPWLWLAVMICGLAVLLLTDRRMERNFLILAAVLGLLTLAVNPVGAGFDEHRHFARAWQLSGGSVAPAATRDGAAIPVPRDLTPLTTLNGIRLSRAFDELWFRPDAGDTVLSREYAVENTAFPAYLPAALGVALGRLLGLPLILIYLLGRLTGLAAYIALCYLALRLTPRYKAVFLALALLPLSLYLAAGYSTDPVLIALGMLYVALWLRGAEKGGLPAADISGMAALLMIMGLIKAPYVLLGLLLLFTPGAFFSRARDRWLAWSAVAAVWILTAGWLLLVQARWGAVPNSVMVDGAANSLDQLRYMASHPLHALTMLVRSLTELSPGWLAGLAAYGNGGCTGGLWQMLTPAVLTGVALTDGPPPERPLRRALLLTALLTACALIIFLYMAWSPVGAALPWGIQGRYFIPLLLVLLPAAARRAVPGAGDGGYRLGGLMTLMGSWTLMNLIGYYY